MDQRDSRAKAADFALQMMRLLRPLDKATVIGPGIAGVPSEVELVDVDDAGTLWLSAPRAGEVGHHDSDARVTLALQGASEFVIATGRAEVVHDAGELRQLCGVADNTSPRAAGTSVLISFYLEEAEVWDDSGSQNIRLLYAAPEPAVSGVHARHREEPSATRLAG